ncbi:MAG: Rrf2 family transcriptional regulator [Flavobacteriaceae bacterium]|nr:Rrf2 family transcriptional regulator [Flavobacteriaceae bacterium]
MTFLATYTDEWITSSHLAKSININAAIVRKELSALRESNLIESKEGKYGGVKLQRASSEITLGDIFKSVKGEAHILGFSKNDGNPNCQVGRSMKDNLGVIYDEMDAMIESSLSRTTLEEFKNRFR